MTATLNVGFIGVGSLTTKQHLPNAHHNPIFKVHGLCDIDEEALETYAQKYHAETTSRRYKDILDDDDVDLVVIATIPEHQARFSLEAVRAGKHVYVEKPLCETTEQAVEIQQEVNRSGKHLALGYNRRFAPSYRDVFRLVQGDAGPIMMNYRMVDDERDRPGWYKGRGRMIDELCHVFDVFNWLARSEPVGIFCSEYGRREDYQVVVEYDNGVTAAAVTSSFGAFGWPKERLDVVGDNKVLAVEDFVELQTAGIEGWTSKNYRGREYEGFSKGYADAYEQIGLPFYRYMRRSMEKLMLGSGLIESEPDKEKWTFIGRRYPDHLRIPINYSCDKGWYDALDHFGRAILEGTTPENATALDAARTTAMSLAALESAKQRSYVRIDTGQWRL